MFQSNPVQKKIFLIGNKNVGVSSILLRFADNSFTQKYIDLLSIGVREKTIKIDNTEIELKLIKKESYNFKEDSPFSLDGHAYLFIFDLTNKESFDSIKQLFESKNINKLTTPHPKIILVGTKNDLVSECKITDEAQEFARSYYIPYFETSSKENINIDTLFIESAKIIKNNFSISQMQEQIALQRLTETGRKLGFFSIKQKIPDHIEQLIAIKAPAVTFKEKKLLLLEIAKILFDAISSHPLLGRNEILENFYVTQFNMAIAELGLHKEQFQLQSSYSFKKG